MMKSSRFENQRKIEDNIIKYVTNLFRLKKIDDSTIKDVRNIFKLKKEISMEHFWAWKTLLQTSKASSLLV